MSNPEHAPGQGSSQGFFQKNHFLLRRLHSLTGILPIGVFLVIHLTTNSSIAWGKLGLRGEHADLSFREGGVAYFWKEVTWINNQVPHLLLTEIVLWGAIAFHSILGVMYAMSGSNNASQYRYGGNVRYALQRLSGYLGILFIFYHVATLRWGWSFLVPGGTQWSSQFSASTLAACLRGSATTVTPMGVLISLFYFLGVSMLVFHFANGLWTSAITWGLTVTERAQKRWGFACAGVGAVMMLLAWSSILGFVLLHPKDAQRVERAVSESHLTPADSVATGNGR